MARILIIDDERSIRNSMKDILTFEGHEVLVAENGLEGLVTLKSEKPEIVFCDIKMPKMEGIEVLERIKEFSRETPVIMISGHGTIDTAIEAIKKRSLRLYRKTPGSQPHTDYHQKRHRQAAAFTGNADTETQSQQKIRNDRPLGSA